MVDNVRVMCPKCKVDVRQFFVREQVLDQIVVDLHCCRCLHQWSECWDVERLNKLIDSGRGDWAAAPGGKEHKSIGNVPGTGLEA